jgi:hypothetical protein
MKDKQKLVKKERLPVGGRMPQGLMIVLHIGGGMPQGLMIVLHRRGLLI